MQEKLQKIKDSFEKKLKSIKDLDSLDILYNEYFSRKAGEMTNIMKSLKDLSGEERKEMGALSNTVKTEMESLFENKKQELENKKWETLLETEKIDITQPKLPQERQGSKHPVTLVHETLENLFTSMGFMLLDGPELESDYYNFEALNIPQNHPARDTQDTFFIKGNKDMVMRTHTSSVQVRAMQKYGAPLRAVVTGRVFRNEAIDASHDHTFYQMEGILIDKNISIANVLGTMKELLAGVFGREVEVRLRPGHFDFVEPGFELDMKCLVCEGKGCGACKHSGWVETLPCGLVHPSVIESGGLDSKEWTGFAFGLGSSRLVMQRYGIEDIRLLHSGRLDFLKQF
ncbi:MAG: phenylalanine--tRNA ligase subunit alpha [Candidatus Magasanikbacteria bacterium CG_4_10_14_0_2_um_filter_33_14]|uniref:Phenylalanine--tRNA ligase alpha subunit n=1 Tax=Candidatus Magasanikbacteria bacterium CG_4_10_14_0_2_um_filter_33_14 TaxID=1974636 RepID=A0A2M7VAS5_9BACT|nr:MAG: phenylalanine--tRNA ligase subunit alpha [Candidatus Magasanikbacteria bacterium CG_4_10_14_0_2_um_filter_33_14]